MRIDANIQESRNLQQRTQEAGKEEQTGVKQNRKEESHSINASELNLMQDSILERKKKAMADAMDIISKQFKADAEIDADLDERRKRITENKERASAALKEINSLSEEQEKLKEAYGIADDSQEQQDLELRMKINKAMKPDSKVKLTKEDLERMQQLGPMTEYQQQVMSLEDAKGLWNEEITAAQKTITEETQIIRGTKLELLKHHGMADAQNAAEASLKAASDEIMGMLMQEGLDHIQEEVEDAVEKGEEQKEEKEEQEALRAEQKAEQTEQTKQQTESGDIQNVQKEVEQQIQEILEKQKLLEEDLKGIQVDNII